MFLTADKVLAVVRVPGGKLGLEFVEAKILEDVTGESAISFSIWSGVQKMWASS